MWCLCCYSFFFLMIPRPPRSTRTDTLFPYTTLFRSGLPTSAQSTSALHGDWTGPLNNPVPGVAAFPLEARSRFRPICRHLRHRDGARHAFAAHLEIGRAHV